MFYIRTPQRCFVRTKAYGKRANVLAGYRPLTEVRQDHGWGREKIIY